MVLTVIHELQDVLDALLVFPLELRELALEEVFQLSFHLFCSIHIAAAVMAFDRVLVVPVPL